MAKQIETGMTVEAGKVGTEDHDTGRVLELDGEKALVAWQSGVRTWSPVEDLSEAE